MAEQENNRDKIKELSLQIKSNMKNHKDLAVIRDKEIISNFDIMRINEYSVEEIEAYKHAITTACFCMDFTAMTLFPGQIVVDDGGKTIQ